MGRYSSMHMTREILLEYLSFTALRAMEMDEARA